MRAALAILVSLLVVTQSPLRDHTDTPQDDIEALTKACDEGDADACKKRDAYHEEKGKRALLNFFGVRTEKQKKDCKDGEVKKDGIFCPIPGNKFKKKKRGHEEAEKPAGDIKEQKEEGEKVEKPDE